jgi:nucleoid DNA-binding protein
MAKAAIKPPTKSQILADMAESTGLSKKDVSAVLDALTDQIKTQMGKGGSGQFTIPGLCKVVVQHKPATKKRQVRNPATGEMVWAAPKPARRVVKVRPLKALKDMAE